jgi:putative transposase
MGRQATPSAGIIDSQSVKITDRGGIHGYDGAKKVNGRKRHILVDTLGLLLTVTVHAANIQDRDGVLLLLAGPIQNRFPRLKHVWLDAAYRSGAKSWIETTLGWTVEVVKPAGRPRGIICEVIERTLGAEEFERRYPKGFKVLPRRWVVERTFAWLGRYRRLSKDYEYLSSTSQTCVYVTMPKLMLARLARFSAPWAFSYTLYNIP